MRRILFFLIAAFISVCDFSTAYGNDVVIHTNKGNGNDQISIDPPQVTYDEELNELYVYFGTTGTIDIEYVDALGTPCYFVQGESHVGYTSTIYTGLPAGYYTITIHSIYGYIYTGNFAVN